MTATTQLMTADELLRLPRGNHRYELIDGELKTMAPAGNKHGKFAMRVGISLGYHVGENNLGETYAAETGFLISTDPDTVRAPDAAFISQERLDAVSEVDGFWPGAPDLVVEVISPSEIYGDVEEKVFDWLEAGCRMVIVINPRKKMATVYQSLTEIVVLTEKDAIDGGRVVPGWKLPLKDIFS